MRSPQEANCNIAPRLSQLNENQSPTYAFTSKSQPQKCVPDSLSDTHASSRLFSQYCGSTYLGLRAARILSAQRLSRYLFFNSRCSMQLYENPRPDLFHLESRKWAAAALASTSERTTTIRAPCRFVGVCSGQTLPSSRLHPFQSYGHREREMRVKTLLRMVELWSSRGMTFSFLTHFLPFSNKSTAIALRPTASPYSDTNWWYASHALVRCYIFGGAYEISAAEIQMATFSEDLQL
ncbi:hypothetical protein BDW62DRAFT_170773 [Aspergillus aurantiobrunneus]